MRVLHGASPSTRPVDGSAEHCSTSLPRRSSRGSAHAPHTLHTPLEHRHCPPLAAYSSLARQDRDFRIRLPHESETSSEQHLPIEDGVSRDYGLSLGQLQALGVLGQGAQDTGPIRAESLVASNFYCGDAATAGRRMTTMMSRGSAGGGPGSAPPDLPSLLLDSRICYIGMPLVPSVTELVLSELLWLNYNSPEKPVYVYLHSAGSQTPNGQAVAFDSEAFAIVDTLGYIKPEVQTLVLGQAHGNAAMILACGKKGKRASLPHASIMTAPPRMNRSFGSTTNIMIKSNELENTTEMYVDLLTKYTGREKDSVRQDMGRNRYFTPAQAVEYGLIDRIIEPQDEVAMVNRDYESELRQQAAQQQANQRGRPSREPEAGF